MEYGNMKILEETDLCEVSEIFKSLDSVEKYT